MTKDLEFLKKINIAHRGLHSQENDIPENSLLAFQKAIDNGDAIEIDLHLLADGHVVVFHDDNLKRMTGYNKLIKNCTLEEIKDLRLLNTDEYIPLLQEVLDLVCGQVLLDIEFKFDQKVGLLESKACELLDNYQGQFVVKSFNPLTVNWFRKNRPEYIRGQLTTAAFGGVKKQINIFRRFVLKSMVANFVTRPDFVAFDIRTVSKRQLRRWEDRLMLWTVRTQEEFALVKKYSNSFIYENFDINEVINQDGTI